MIPIRGRLPLAALAVMMAAAPASARPHHRHHHPRPAVAPAAPAPAEAPFSFYPETVEGGVPGNLSFNNQIRKHTDPLNANGGR